MPSLYWRPATLGKPAPKSAIILRIMVQQNSSPIPSRAETLKVLRLMGDYDHLLMLTGSEDGYGTRWTLGGQQVQPGIARYLMDSRTGNPNGYLYSGGAGNWTNFYADLSPIAANWASIPKDRWVAFYADTAAQYTATINLMSRYSNSETLPGKLGVVLVYNRKLTQAEMLQNFNAYRNRYGL